MKQIALSLLHAHPNNPRLSPRADIVDQIAAQLDGSLDEAHALIVRPNAAGFEIISGHHRFLAAQKAGLATVPCWVREMSDADAYMALALNNAQGELSPLEVGLHALGSGLGIRDYAKAIGISESTLGTRVKAARVSAVTDIGDASSVWSQLAELHAAPGWLWLALVARLMADDWTVDTARKAAQRCKEIAEPPDWAAREVLATAIVGGAMKASDLRLFSSMVERTTAILAKNGEDTERLTIQFHKRLSETKPGTVSAVQGICNAIEDEQRALIQQRQQADLARTRREEEIAARIARLRRNVLLGEWKTLESDEQVGLMTLDAEIGIGKFNKQENDSIEWAQWSWNPVTGCEHTCPYCYARDIANDPKMAKVYPHGFEPTFRPLTVLAPRSMTVPKEAETDTRFRNVFTCSMADLFGRWVPKEWIETVLREIRSAPEWNFLCLTKFPKRMAEFDIPNNAWMGTTVDLQARVPAAEAAFERVNAGIKWLSVEPMLEPLKFKHLERFDWIVIGGSSRSSQTPEWHPPAEWILDLEMQARAADVAIYEKTNLRAGHYKRIIELPFAAPVKSDNTPSSAVFHYLTKTPV